MASGDGFSSCAFITVATTIRIAYKFKLNVNRDGSNVLSDDITIEIEDDPITIPSGMGVDSYFDLDIYDVSYDMYQGPGHVAAYRFEEGTLILDFVGAKTKQLIWRGSAKAEIDSAIVWKGNELRIDARSIGSMERTVEYAYLYGVTMQTPEITKKKKRSPK